MATNKHILALLLAASFFVAPASSSVASPTANPTAGRGKMTTPLEFELKTPVDGAPASEFAGIDLIIRTRASLGAIQLSILADEGIQVLASTEMSLEPLAANGQTTVHVPLRLGFQERSAIRVRVSAPSADGSETWQATRIVSVLVRDGRAWSGTAGFTSLDLAAVEAALRDGKLSEDAARDARRAARQLTGSFDQSPRVQRPQTAAEKELSDLIRGVNPDGNVPVTPAGGCITVQGNVRWRDENGNLHPLFGISVQIWDEDLGFDEFVEVTATDQNGNYSIMVNNDDGIGAGDRDIYVKFVTFNNAISVEPDAILTGPYEADSPVHDETPCNTTITENFTAANTGTGPSASVLEGMSWIAVYTAQRNSGTFLGQILVEWPTSESTSSYDGGELSILELDRWDWDVLHHEYGHYTMDEFDFEDNPGGDHGIGDCASDERSDKGEGTRLAWGEGWPTYFGTSAQQVLGLASLNVPRVGDVNYQDTEDLNSSYSLESQGTTGGEDNEAAVQRLFWDLHDSVNDGRDAVDASHATLFDLVNASNAVRLSQAWAAIRTTLSDADQLAFGEVAADHKMGPTLNSPAQGTTVSPSSNNNFSWNRAVGCSADFDGDSFSLRFFRTDNAAPILSIPVGNTTTASLTLAQFQTLVAATHNVTWAVEGSNTTSPATGPYLGESFNIVVNRPPVAVAGDDIVAECTSPTTTAVQLNGTGSSDPDGDPITWSWSAVGIAFDNPNSSTPIGQFPIGTTIVTLTVSDGIETDTDEVSVTVDDTTPPVVACPQNITIECNDHCEDGGVPSNDPQLVNFFAAFSATDVCDEDPVLTDDRLACFPLGTTTVTFTACDHHTNCSSCTADVTVVDTTPPEITVTLNREVLWPPNHTLAEISATIVVTDVCDPNPTFVLTSITSDEPDNGLGDGDTANDIQGADLGIADTAFLLRSERGGLGDGRLYTILYTASDGSGNTSEATVSVRVPHDRRGPAVASTGFTPNGSAIVSGSTRLQIIVLSSSTLATSGIDPQQAYVGNELGALRSVAHRRADLNGDGAADLQVVYEAGPTGALQTASVGSTPVGLHYTASGVDYLVDDIFALGQPLLVALAEPEAAPGERRQPGKRAETTASSTGGESSPGGDSSGDSDQDGDPIPTTGSQAQPYAQAESPSDLVLTTPGRVRVDVYDVTGRRIRTLLDATLGAGAHRLVWDGRNHAGQRAASGVYFYRIEAPGLATVRKFLLVR